MTIRTIWFAACSFILINISNSSQIFRKSIQNSKLRSETWRALEQFYKQGDETLGLPAVVNPLCIIRLRDSSSCSNAEHVEYREMSGNWSEQLH